MRTPRTDQAYNASNGDDHIRVSAMLAESERLEAELTAATESFRLLMAQIKAMRDRAEKYAEDDEANQDFEAASRQRFAEGILSEILRLGVHFSKA